MRAGDTSKAFPIFLLAAAMLVLSGCGEDSDERQQETPTTEETRPEQPDATQEKRKPTPEEEEFRQQPSPQSEEGLPEQGPQVPPPPRIGEEDIMVPDEGAKEPSLEKPALSKPQSDSSVSEKSDAQASDEEKIEKPPPLSEDERLHRVFFESDSAELSSDAKETVKTVVRIMEDHPEATANLKGFTDQSGQVAYNRKLAKRRAAAVSDALTNAGIDESRIREDVHGEADPATAPANKDPSQWGRRVEITLNE